MRSCSRRWPPASSAHGGGKQPSTTLGRALKTVQISTKLVGTWRGWSAKGTTALGPCSFRSWQGPPGPGSGSMREGLLTRRTAPAGEALHGSHTLLYVDSMNLIICSRCGCYASIYADNLANECLKQGHPRTAKGKQHLARVQKGAWPHPQGMPKRVREVLHVRDAQRAIAQANLDARTRLGCIA